MAGRRAGVSFIGIAAGIDHAGSMMCDQVGYTALRCTLFLCQSDDECGEHFCNGGLCTFSCTLDQQCASDEICQSASCEMAACSNDSDCGSGEVCERDFAGRQCVAQVVDELPSAPVFTNSGCPRGMRCSEALGMNGETTTVCLPAVAALTCNTLIGCPDGYTCDNGICVEERRSTGGPGLDCIPNPNCPAN